MMRKQFFLWLVLLCTLTITSCKDDDTIDINDYNKQTILVYMPWSGSAQHKGLYNFFLQNLDSIESGVKAQKGLKNSRLVVFLSKSPTESELYEVGYVNKQITHTPIKTYSGKAYTTAEGIAQIINDTKAAAEALNYALIIGCHGTGWTYKENWKDYPYNAKRYAFSTRQQPTYWEQTRFFGSVDDILNYATDIETLAKGIAQTGTKMQYILFDDCYMANVETAYMLKDVTNFLVGSTSEVMAVGMPYADMWSSLASPTPNYGAIVKKFHDFYSNYRVPSGTIAAIDCREVEALAAVMKDINAKYSLDDSLRDSVQVLDGFKAGIFFDMGDYVKWLCKNKNLRERFNQQLTKAVRHQSHTDTIYSYIYPFEGPKYIPVKTFSGLTISDPTIHVAPLRGIQNTAWWKATH